MEGRYNVRSPAVKRLMKEAQELSEPTDQYFAQPLEDNLFEWHFTVRGPADSDFQNGTYHGRIILPVDYPMKPPSIIWLTPNGRFETNKKICLSISGHHPESWQPSWSIRTALLAIIGFMPTHPGGAIGSLDYKPDERKVLAKKSRSWKCPSCGDVSHILLEVSSGSQSASKEAKELAAQISFQGEKPKNKPDEKSAEDAEKKDSPSSENGNKAATTSTLSSGPNATGNTLKSADDKQVPSPLPASASGANSTPPTPTAATTTPGAPFFGTPASPLPPSGVPPPPWNASPPFQPYSFYMGQNAPTSMSAMPLRFPYPPSYYTTASSFYPTGCALPPGVGMFPCPFPPPPPHLSHVPASSAHTMISANNSSVPNTTHGTRAQTSVSYMQSPLTNPSTVSQPQGGVSNEKTVSRSDQEQAESKPQKADQKQVMNELLTKVRRVGSDEKNVNSQDEKESPVDVNKEMHTNTETPEECGEAMDKELSHVNGQNITEETCTDSEVSKSLWKTNSRGDITNSEVLPSDMENSEIGVPPLEVSESELRSVLEKSTCNSTPELEKLKGKQLVHKGLRQRQSATTSVNTNTEVYDEGATVPDPSVAVLRQRIEAESGDSRPGNLIRPGDQAPTPRARHINQETVGAAQPRQSSYDITFFLMVIFFISAVGILLNRLLRLYWAVDLP